MINSKYTNGEVVMKKYKAIAFLCSLILTLSTLFLVACNPGGDESIDPSKFISGITVLYKPVAGSTDDEFVDGFTNNSMKFNALLDRQFSMIADDILFRLNGVYGSGYMADGIRLTDASNNDVSYATKVASYLKKDGIMAYNEGYKYSDGSAASEAALDITQPAAYAFTMHGADGAGLGTFTYSAASTNSLVKNFSFAGAIGGTKFNRDTELSFIADVNKAWKWSNASYYIDRTTDYKKFVKNALSVILTTGIVDVEATATTFDIAETDYVNNLSNMSHLGILSYDKELIKQFIKYNIIGKDLIDADNAILESLQSKTTLTNFNYNIEPDATTLESMTPEQIAELNTLHEYKAYEVIVDSIVETMLTNKFSETIVPIYPAAARLKFEHVKYSDMDVTETNENGQTTNKQYWCEKPNVVSVIIRPKAKHILGSIQGGLEYFGTKMKDAQGNELDEIFIKVNVTYMCYGKEYKGSTSTNVSYGSVSGESTLPEVDTSNNKTSSGVTGDKPDTGECPTINEYRIYAQDVFEQQLKDEGRLTDDGNVIPPWIGRYEFDVDGAITTINNPFTMVQTDSVSTAMYFNCGSNYIELSFEFFSDADCTVACLSVPDYKFSMDTSFDVTEDEDAFKNSADYKPE